MCVKYAMWMLVHVVLEINDIIMKIDIMELKKALIKNGDEKLDVSEWDSWSEENYNDFWRKEGWMERGNVG